MKLIEITIALILAFLALLVAPFLWIISKSLDGVWRIKGE